MNMLFVTDEPVNNDDSIVEVMVKLKIPKPLPVVVMNLVNNAVKYSLADKHVIIKTEQLPDCLRVLVVDFGIGMSQKEIERIFERFYRVEDKKFMASGLGMGLYISAEIVNAHNGKIGVESEPGKGSTFYFDLPV